MRGSAACLDWLLRDRGDEFLAGYFGAYVAFIVIGLWLAFSRSCGVDDSAVGA